MKLQTIIFVFFACLHHVKPTYNPPTTYDLLDICGQKISTSEDIILTVSVVLNEPNTHSCQAAFESDIDNDRLLIQVLDMDIPHSTHCQHTRVHVVGIEGGRGAGILCGSNITTPVFNSTDQFVHVSYWNTGHHENVSLTLLFSSFHTKDQGKCTSYEFACSNDLCIDGDLACNGFDDCSDNSDETIGCKPNPTHRILLIVSLPVVGGIFFVTVSIVCLVKIRRARNRGGKYLPID